MSDLYKIQPYVVRVAGTDVPPEEVQAAINSLAVQTTIALNAIVGGGPVGPAGGDLSGTFPNPTVSAVHATTGTLDGVVIGATTPAAGHFTTLSATSISGLTTALSVAQGGTGQTALSAHNVLLGEGTSAVGFAAPGANGTIFSSTGTGVDPSFQTAGALGLALTANPLSQFAATTSAQLAGVISDETGTGALVFNNNPSLSGATINGGSVGATTPGTGSFTSLAASGTVSGTGFSNYLASPPAIGGTAAAAGKFTTLQATSTITPSSTAGIVGTTTNDNANAGSVGEYVTATGSAVSLTTATPTNITSISLTAGDWEVSGAYGITPAGTTTVTAMIGGINSTSATFPSFPFETILQGSLATGGQQSQAAAPQRFSLSATTTIYLVVQANFGVSTCTATGIIRARRVR